MVVLVVGVTGMGVTRVGDGTVMVGTTDVLFSADSLTSTNSIHVQY